MAAMASRRCEMMRPDSDETYFRRLNAQRRIGGGEETGMGG